MKKLILYSILSVAQFFIIANANAAVSPVGISILPPVQFPPADFDVTGVRASVLWGHHRNFYGLDLALGGNITDQNFYGIGVAGLFNYTAGTTAGMQIAGGANINKNKTTIVGLQAAILTNINTAASSVTGLQVAIANLSDHTNIYGVQAGIYNVAQAVYGLQIGLVNVTNNLHGLQIGLVNFHHEGVFKVSPILNFGF
jgi:hypothetical protein